MSAYLAAIGRKGGKAGTGKSKARTRKQAQAAARMRWANETRGKDAQQGIDPTSEKA